MRNARPWEDYVLRGIACAGLLVAGYFLVSRSTFIFRIRTDIPAFVPGLDGPQSVAAAIALGLAVLPLLAGKRFLAAYLASCFSASAIGAYWWTTLPWHRIYRGSDFSSKTPAAFGDYALVATPVILASLYVALSRASVLRADYRARGADESEAVTVARRSLAVGAGATAVAAMLTGGLWWILVNGTLRDAPPIPKGPTAVLVAAGAVALAAMLGEPRVFRSLFRRRPKSPPAAS